MKKLRLLMFASLVATGASAQYFQHDYGTQRREHLESGVNANLIYGWQDHIMTGYTDVSGMNSLMVTRTDLDGRFVGSPFTFNQEFKITENGVQVDAKGRRVIHPNAFGGPISIWGDYGYTAGGPSTNFFYAQIPPNGGPGAIFSFTLGMPVDEVEATSMVESTSNPGTLFMCGYVRIQPGGIRQPMVMSFNGNTSTINWAFVYQVANNFDWTAMDLVESPFLPSTGIPDIALVGHFTRPGFPESGCFFTVSTPNGVLGPVVEYGAPFNGIKCGLDAIDIANNPFGQGPGFALAGYCYHQAIGNNDAWAMKVSPNGFIIDFTTLIDYSMPGNDNYGYDIIERKNQAGNFEYYVGGYVTPNGFWGAEDAVVDKLDFSGIGVPLGQFSFGRGGNERALQLDQYNNIGPNNDGLSVYGITDGSFPLVGATDFYFVKSYFNGVTACLYDLQDPPWRRGPGIAEWWSGNNPYKLKQGNLRMDTTSVQDFEICWVKDTINGSNARIASSTAGQEVLQPGYFPNPVSRDNANVTVTFGKEVVAGDAEIELWNSIGQLLWTKKVSVADGQTEMKVELGNELSGGMYHLIVRQNGALNNYRILVQ